MIGRRLVCYAEPRTQPGINRPRHERVSLERSPPDPPVAAGKIRAALTFHCRAAYPIGLANRRKPNGKDFLIIVNGRAIGATVPAEGSPLRAVRAECDFSAILRPGWGQIGGPDAIFPAVDLVNCGGAGSGYRRPGSIGQAVAARTVLTIGIVDDAPFTRALTPPCHTLPVKGDEEPPGGEDGGASAKNAPALKSIWRSVQRWRRRRLAPAEPAIDRAHLARMTHGERDLEREVLQLYATQADLLLGRMGQASPPAVGALGAHAQRLVARRRRLAGRGRGRRRRGGCCRGPRHGGVGRAAGLRDPRRAGRTSWS